RLLTVLVLRKIQTKARRERYRPLEPSLEQGLQAAGPDPSEALSARELLEIAAQVAGQYWPLVQARVFDKRPFEELEREFHTSAATLRQRCRRALEKIRDRLEEVDNE